MTAALILHHKSVSPYSEKIRLMLGYSGLYWQSLEIPLTPPRPSLDPLINGYRRVPVAQLGGDLFCDTRLIANEIARLAQRPELSPFQQDHAQWHQSEFIETDMFHHCVNSLPMMGLLKALLQQIRWREIPGYLADKKHLIAHASPELQATKPSRGISRRHWHKHLAELEQQLTQPFLYGTRPGYLDFCAVHMIWFRAGMEGSRPFRQRPALQAWYERLSRYGHGEYETITTAQALTQASQPPRAVPESMRQGAEIGSTVRVQNTDILLGATTGILVGEDETRWILARETESTGTVHIHFPRTGYRLESVQDVQS